MKFLRQSIYDKTNVQDAYSKAAQYGVSGAKTMYAASLDLSPADVINLSYIEDTILGMTTEIFNKPMVSSNTRSYSSDTTTSGWGNRLRTGGTTDTGGRPTNEERGVETTESGVASQESDQAANAEIT